MARPKAENGIRDSAVKVTDTVFHNLQTGRQGFTPLAYQDGEKCVLGIIYEIPLDNNHFSCYI
jgi:hypothetical protein